MESRKGKRRSFRNAQAISEWTNLGRIKEIVTLNVSPRGDGLCVYLPKDFCEVYGIRSGDRIKIEFREHFRRQRQQED